MIPYNSITRRLALFSFFVVSWSLSANAGQAFKQNDHSVSVLTNAEPFAVKAIAHILPGNDKILFGILIRGQNHRAKKAEVRLVRAGRVISSIQFKPIGDLANCNFSLKLLENKGFSSNPKLLVCNFAYPAGGHIHGDVILALKDDQFSYGLEASTSGNEDVTGSFSYIFPISKSGKADRLTVLYTLTPRDESTGALDRKHAEHERDIYAWDKTKFKHVAGSHYLSSSHS